MSGRSSTDSVPSPRAPDGVAVLLSGSVVSGLAAYAFQVVATRALGEQDYAPIGVLWTIQYLVFSVLLYPVETYLTRLRLHRSEGAALPVGVLRDVVLFTVVVAVVLGAMTYGAREALFPQSPGLTPVIVAIVLAYAAYSVVRGLLAGALDYRTYALATSFEGVSRLVLVAGVVVAGASVEGVAWTLPVAGAVGAAAWLLRAKGSGGQAAARPGTEPGRARRFLVATVPVGAAAQALLAAAPLVVVPLGATATEVSVCFVTMTLVRAPLVLGFGGLLSRVLPPLARRAAAGDDAGLRAIGFRIVCACLGAGAVAAAVAALIAPTMISVFFGTGFRPGAAFVSLAAGAAVAATGNLLLNQVLIARHSEARLTAPWLVAVAAAAAALVLVDFSPLIAAGTALLVGELVAMVGLTLALLSAPALLVSSGQSAETPRTP